VIDWMQERRVLLHANRTWQVAVAASAG
jgi:hypothetical protein